MAYTDARGTPESLVSAPTSEVENVNSAQTCFLFCFDDFGLASLEYENVIIYDYNADWTAGVNTYNIDSLEPDELSQLPYYEGFGLDVVPDDIEGIYYKFYDENDLEKDTSDYAAGDFTDNDEVNDYFAWSFDNVSNSYVLDFLNDLDGFDTHPWLPEGLEQGLYLTHYESYEDLDGTVDFYNTDDTDDYYKVDLDPELDYAFYNWEENISPIEGTESFSLLTDADINRLRETDYLPDELTHGDIVLNNFFDQLNLENKNNIEVIAIDISDDVAGESIWNDQYFMNNFSVLFDQIATEQGVDGGDLVVANFSNTMPGFYPEQINDFIEGGAYVTWALPNDGKWANRFWDAFANENIVAQPDTLHVSGTEQGQEGFPASLVYSVVAAPSNDSRGTSAYGTSYAAPKVAAEIANLYFDTVSSTPSFESLSFLEMAEVLNRSFLVNQLPTGSIAIVGVPKQGSELTADTSNLVDVDGLGSLKYQWMASGDPIAGANADSFTPGQSEVGKAITVAVSYTDAQGTSENLVSTPTSTIENTNDTPTGTIAILGPFEQGSELTADTSNLDDVDGLGALNYQWLAGGVPIADANADSFTLGQSEVGKTISVAVNYIDSHGTPESLESAPTSAIKEAMIANGYIVGPGVDLTDADLTGADLTGANLTGADLTGANLTGANLTDANLNGADFTNADLTNAYLTNAYLTSTNLVGANLMGADLADADLMGADLTSANLHGVSSGFIVGVATFSASYSVINGYIMGPGVDLTDADLTGADLTDADLTGADLTGVSSGSIVGFAGFPTSYSVINGYIVGPGVDLTDADLTDADLTSADLTGADLTFADLTSADLTGADLSNAYLMGTDLTAANLTAANLTFADLSNATLNGADLTGTNLTSANLTGAKLIGANFSNATLKYTTLSKADLSDAILTNAQMQNSYMIEGDLTGANLQGANLSDAVVLHSNLEETNLSKTILTRATLGGSESNMSGVNLSDANLDSAQINYANLTGSDLSGASLINAGLERSDLTNANLDGANFTSASMAYAQLSGVNSTGTNFTEVYLFGATLASASLTDVNLNNAHLNMANLSQAILTNTDLSYVNLSDVDLSGVHLTGVDLTGAELKGIKSGQITETSSFLPDDYKIINGYIVGPAVNLAGADLAGADLDGVDLTGANLTNADLRGIDFANVNLTDTTLDFVIFNNEPTGTIAVSGTLEQGLELTADTSNLDDVDGLGPLSYQWLASGDPIASANADSYTIGQSEVGKTISVAVSYTDAYGTSESLVSAPTSAIENTNDTPTGTIAVVGTFEQGAKLTADTSDLDDVDGLGALNYQWLA
ncbi:pentapeptide repeat-containing protein, partial [Paracoccaceae bacterium]|nr:pentapeptide repeat-containing protein [Paracoccaceae bacterium]